MPELNEGIAVAVDVESTEKELACDWKDCEKKHPQQITYPGGGTVERNSSYKNDWVAANLEPWVKYGAGKDSKATLQDYQSETPKASYAATAASLVHPEYHTQKHHLISVNLFGNVSKLSHDAKLIGYDVNHKNNGVCLPTYVIDIIRHDLQCHRGSHPNNLYNAKITPLLREMEKQCVDYCKADLFCNMNSQMRLMDDLNRLSTRVESQIKAWKWLLRSEAIAERAQSEAIYKSRTAQS